MKLYRSRHIKIEGMSENGLRLLTKITQKWSRMLFEKKSGSDDIHHIFVSGFKFKEGTHLKPEHVDHIVSSDPKIQADWLILKDILTEQIKTEDFYLEQIAKNEKEMRGRTKS